MADLALQGIYHVVLGEKGGKNTVARLKLIFFLIGGVFVPSNKFFCGLISGTSNWFLCKQHSLTIYFERALLFKKHRVENSNSI